MSNFDLIKMALRNLIKRKLRTSLTVLGVVIGTASIVVMVSLGVGMSISFDNMIDQMGNITVINVESEAYWNTSAPKGTPVIDDKNLMIFEGIKGVEAVTPVIRGDFQISSGKYQLWGNIMGIDMTMYERLGYKLETGRLPGEGDKNGIVMGANVVQNAYNPRVRNSWLNPPQLDPIEDSFEISVTYLTDSKGKPIVKPQKLTVTGVTPPDNDSSYSIFMDIGTVNALNAEKKKVEDKYFKEQGQKNNNTQQNNGYAQALVKCKDMDSVSGAQEQIREMGFNAWSQGEWISSMKQTSQSIQALLGAIGAVSLFVAAIGITNTMLMSIYERTREIGIMKVIGATIADIKRLFLVEAAVIGFFGGLFGLGLSLLLSFLVNNSGILSFMGQMNYGMGEAAKMSVIPVWLSLGALGFSTVVGIVSGYFPARRAMKLSALAAIRTE